MRLQILDRTIQQKQISVLGVQGDNRVETVEFVLPRYCNGVDLSEGIAFIVYRRQSDKEEGLVRIDQTLEDDNIVLSWIIGSQITEVSGIIEVGIKISGPDAVLWGSKITTFVIERSIPFESPQPIYRSRAAAMPMIAEPENEIPITVAERKIIIPAMLQTIAVQNDANSETVTIEMPRWFDGNDLAQYNIFLKTILPEDNGRDDVPLFPKSTTGNVLSMSWTLKPPQTSYSGSLGLQIYVIGTRQDGSSFKWETLDATITIARSLDGDPVIPTTPSVMEEFLKQITEIQQKAKSSETSAANSATSAQTSASNAAASATAAATSATNAKASEENAKKSETSASGSLTDINTGLAGKLSIADANNFIKSVSLDESTGIFTFTRYDDTTFTIDTALEKAVVNFKYDATTNELVLELEDGTEQRIDMTAFTNIYEGSETATILVSVNGNKIEANVKGNSININLLSEQLQNLINGKVTAGADNNASQIKFSDGKTMQEKLDSGELNGKDGVSVSISGIFSFEGDIYGNLYAVYADGGNPPKFETDSNNDIYYVIPD